MCVCHNDTDKFIICELALLEEVLHIVKNVANIPITIIKNHLIPYYLKEFKSIYQLNESTFLHVSC